MKYVLTYLYTMTYNLKHVRLRDRCMGGLHHFSAFVKILDPGDQKPKKISWRSPTGETNINVNFFQSSNQNYWIIPLSSASSKPEKLENTKKGETAAGSLQYLRPDSGSGGGGQSGKHQFSNCTENFLLLRQSNLIFWVEFRMTEKVEESQR